VRQLFGSIHKALARARIVTRLKLAAVLAFAELKLLASLVPSWIGLGVKRHNTAIRAATKGPRAAWLRTCPVAAKRLPVPGA
jgi:hypothetical protein